MRPLRSTLVAAALLAAGPSVYAATLEKAANTNALSTGTSWVGGVAPGSADTGRWSSLATNGVTVSLGANLAWQAVQIANPTGDVTLLAGNTLTLGSSGSGLDLGSATRDLAVRCGLVVTGDQDWAVGAGRTLTLAGGVSAAANNLTTKTGAGTVLFGAATNIFYDLHNSGGGAIVQTGGVLTVQNYYRAAYYASGLSLHRGGTFNAGAILMIGYGAGGTGGTMVVTGSANVVASEVRMTQANTGRLHLDGGTFSCRVFTDAGGQSELYFNGGLLRAREDRTDFLQGLNVVELREGGLRLDTQGYDLTIAQSLTSATNGGGLSKSGTGALRLTGTNLIAGPVVVSNGTLRIDGRLTGTNRVVVRSGTLLTGAGSVSGAVEVADGAVFAPVPAGTNAFRAAALSFSNSAVLQIALGPAGTGAPEVAVSGNLTLDGQLWITNTVALATGSVWTVLTYGGALTDRGLTIHPQSTWDAAILTNVAGQVRLQLVRAFPFVDVATNFLSATGTTASLSVDLHGVTTEPMWYEVRDAAGRLWDQGAHAPATPWPFVARHLREGTNTVTVFARTTSGQTMSNTIRVALNLGPNPAVRPRPWPAEIWWGGTSHTNLYSGGSIVGTVSKLNQFLEPTNTWDFVKRWQDGFLLHGYVWVNGIARMTNWVQVGQSLAAQTAPYRGRFWLENAWRPRTNDMNYGINSAAGQASDVDDLAGADLVVGEITQDYNPMAGDFSAWKPAWPPRDIMALGTGDTNGVSPAYPYTTGQWRDFLTTFAAARPHVQVGWTWSPVYFHWRTGPAIADSLVFAITNGTNVYSFNYDFADFMESAQRVGHATGRRFTFASDCPWGWYGTWGNVAVRDANQQKIRDYEAWLQTNGMRHTMICNHAVSDSLIPTPDAWDANFKSGSLNLLHEHQLDGGRALRYLFESWYAGPFTVVPETKAGSHANLVLEAIKFIKGVRDTNGTPEQLDLTNVTAGVTNTIVLRNNGDLACLPALNAFETGATNIAVRYYTTNGVEITSRIRSADGWSPTNLLATGATLSVRAVATLPAQIGDTTRTVSIEAFWNPQDPSGLVRDRVTFTYGDTQPAPWAAQDIGAVGLAGAATYSNGVLTLSASGADLWGAADEFGFFYATRSGDGAITARIVSQDPTDPWAKAGVMVRASLATNAAYAAFLVTSSNGIAHQSRLTNGAVTTSTTTPGAAPYWVRMMRNGSVLQSYHSPNGTNWTYWRTTTLTNPGADLLWGIAVTAHNDAQLSEAVVDNLVLNSTPDVVTPTNHAVIAGATLAVTNAATDFDLPGQTLTWTKVLGPAAAVVTTNGVLTWRPPAATPPQATAVVVRVTDNGVPPLFATQALHVAVSPPATAVVQSVSFSATGLAFTVGGSTGLDYWVQGSSNLAIWTPVAVVSNAAPPVVLPVPLTNGPVRFHRVLLGP